MTFAGTTFFHAPPKNLSEDLDNRLPPGKIVSVFSTASEVGGSLHYLQELDKKVSIPGKQRLWTSPHSREDIQAFSAANRLSAVRVVMHDEDPRSSTPPVVIGAAVLLHQPSLENMTSPDPSGIRIPDCLGARLIIAVEDDYRKCGVARYLIEKAETLLRPEDRSHMNVILPLDENAQLTREIFERKFGFETYERDDASQGKNIILFKFCMSWDL